MTYDFSATTIVLLCLAACAPVVDWITTATGNRRARWLTKGLPPALLVLALALHSVEHPKPTWAATIAAIGLCFCLVGDYLILDSHRFVPGLLAFGVAHLVFIACFVADLHWDLRDADHSMIPGRIVAIAVVVIAGSVPGRKILRAAARQRRLTVVLIYMVVIAAMLFVAGLHTAAPDGWLAFGGALLFFVSDSVLGWRRFVSRSSSTAGDLAVIVPYHLALGLIGAWALMV